MGRPTVIQWGTPPARYYKDILMRANPTLHEEAFDLLRQAVPSGSRVIDVGSGQGAFVARLRDSGYEVTAVDKDPDDFRAKDVDFIQTDFDSPGQIAEFRQLHEGRYDAAVGMEVIEHVENPWEYCRFLLSLVRPGGVVLLTTPNAESAQSRVELLLTGMFTHFSEADHAGSGHINPLTFHELRLIADGVGATTLEARAICPLPLLVVSRRLGVVLRSVLAAVLRPFMGPRASGDIICFLLKRPD
jgi:SAM-dependent methyltransferase